MLTLAGEGKSREDLKAEISRLKAAGTPPRPQVLQVGKVLSSRKWSASLDAKAQSEVEKWLARMPKVVREALDSGA